MLLKWGSCFAKDLHSSTSALLACFVSKVYSFSFYVPAYMYVYQNRVSASLEAELQKVVSHLIGAGNQDLVLTTEPLPRALVLTSFFTLTH